MVIIFARSAFQNFGQLRGPIASLRDWREGANLDALSFQASHRGAPGDPRRRDAASAEHGTTYRALEASRRAGKVRVRTPHDGPAGQAV